MNTPANETQENKSQTAANPVAQNQSTGEQTFQLADNRPEAIVQRKLHEMANNSWQQKRAVQLHAIANSHRSQQDVPLQKKAASGSATRANNTGLPNNLKSGIENLSGYSMDDVKVHRNSDKPAQLQAHAYAQGTDIHLGPGQEKHLPHEAWHVVQQKQGRVKPTLQMKGKVNVNDDAGLEKEADVMGKKANQQVTTENNNPPVQKFANPKAETATIQRAIGFEFETNALLKNNNLKYKHPLHNEGWDGKSVEAYGPGWHAHVDGGKVEFSTQPIETKGDLDVQMNSLTTAANKMENELDSSREKTIPIKEAIGRGNSEENLVTRIGGKNLYKAGIYADIQNTVSLELSQVPKFYEGMANSKSVKPYDKISHPMYTPMHLKSPVKLELPPPSTIVNVHLVECVGVNPKLWRKMEVGEHKNDQGDISPDVAMVQIGNMDLSWLDDYKGLATIIVDYLNDFMISNSLKSQSEYVKSDFPLLQRVNFVKMFKSLNLDEDSKQFIGESLPKLVVTWADRLIKLNQKNEYLKKLEKSYKLFNKEHDMNRFLNSINTAKASQDMKHTDLPSVGTWFEGIMDGKDKLSSLDNGALDSKSMGNLPMDNVGQTPKTIIENRALGTRNLIKEWAKIATDVFEDYEEKTKQT